MPQYLRATDVHSSLTSQQVRWPPSARPRAMQIEEYPVKVPISRARRAPVRRASIVIRVPCSGPICMPAASGQLAAVSAASCSSRSSGLALCETT